MTVVEWLYNHLFPKQLDGFSDEEWNKIDLAFKQAKEMEKEQMLNAFQESRLTHPMIGFKHETFVDYYKETFKSE